MNFSFNVKEIHYKAKTVLINTTTGNWVRLSDECLNIIKVAINNSYSYEQLMKSLADDEDRSLMSKVIDNLYRIGLLEDTMPSKIVSKNVNYTFIVTITNRCNLQCKHCAVSAKTVLEEEHLDREQLISLFDKVIDCAPKGINITGGEPMVRNDFYDIIEHIREKYTGSLGLLTNGTLITKNNAQFIAKNFTSVDLSLDGVDEKSCAKVRGPGVYAKVINSISLLKNEGMDELSLSMIFTQDNYLLRDQFTSLCEHLQVKSVFRIYEAVGRGKDNKNLFIEDKVVSFRNNHDIPEASTQTIRPHACCCGAGISEFSIKEDGSLYPCQSLDHQSFYINNIMNIEDLSTYLTTSHEIQESRRRVASVQPDQMDPCSSCAVSLFCWGCPDILLRYKKSSLAIEEKCRLNKKTLYKLVWGE